MSTVRFLYFKNLITFHYYYYYYYHHHHDYYYSWFSRRILIDI